MQTGRLEDNLAAADLKLTEYEVEKLDEVSVIEPDHPGWMLVAQATGRLGPVQGGTWANRMNTE